MGSQVSIERLLSLLNSPSELPALDFKETLDLNHARDRVELAKDVLAMANSGGGHIVIGIEDSTRKLVGLAGTALSSLHESKVVNDKLKKYTGGYIRVWVAQHQWQTGNGSIVLGLIYVPPAAFKIPAQDDGVYPEPANPNKQRWTFRKGDIYVRKGDESVKVETPDDLWPVRPSQPFDAVSARELVDGYSKRFSDSLGFELPPILPNESVDEISGRNLVELLSRPMDCLLLGPSGLGKSLHLKYFCQAALKRGELVLLAFCKRYTGGPLLDLLDRDASRFTASGVKTLLEAAEFSNISTVIAFDGLSECHAHVEDLFKEIQAFRLRYRFRVVASSQIDNLPPGHSEVERLFLSPLSKIQKRLIYSYNAQVPPTNQIDHLCEGFSNGYDLALAGRCHRIGESELTRVELYERYCRHSLPRSTTLSEALARNLAARMADQLSTFLIRDDFERVSEGFLSSQNASLELLDQLKSSRLVKVTEDIFSFEHDLLLEYLRAEHERRKPSAPNLSELAKPSNQALIPFLLPRYSDEAVLRSIFTTVSSYVTFREILAGHCGKAPKQALLADCVAAIEGASDDLPNTTMNCNEEQLQGPLPLFSIRFSGKRTLSEYEVKLCDVIAIGLDLEELQNRFFELLDMTQWTLREKARTAAADCGSSFGKVWQIIVGQLDMMGEQNLLPFRVVSRLREITMREHRRGGFYLQDQLWERINKNPNDHFSLSILLEGLSHCWPDKEFLKIYAKLARIAWDTKVYHLRLKTLHLLHQTRWHFESQMPDQIEAIKVLVSSFDTSNIFLNSLLIEVLVAYGAIPSIKTSEEAAEEMRAVLDAASKRVKSGDEANLSNIAYDLIANQFEDIFQGAYNEGFESLSPTDQVALLRLAARSERSGLTSTWILNQLLRSRDVAALPIFQLCASRIDSESSFPQEAAGTFALGIAGCATFMENPVPFSDSSSPDLRAWQICGEILFWTLRRRSVALDEDGRILKLWERLRNETSLAAADVLHRLIGGVRLVVYEDAEVRKYDLVAQWPNEAGSILRESLRNRGLLTSIFGFGGSKDHGLVKFLIESLGRIIDKASIPLLTVLADDLEYGDVAIAALHKIRRLTAPQ